MNKYKKVSSEILTRFSEILGAKNVSTDPDDMEKHGIDESSLDPHFPEVVVRPSTTEEISEIMKLANEKKYQ